MPVERFACSGRQGWERGCEARLWTESCSLCFSLKVGTPKQAEAVSKSQGVMKGGLAGEIFDLYSIHTQGSAEAKGQGFIQLRW